MTKTSIIKPPEIRIKLLKFSFTIFQENALLKHLCKSISYARFGHQSNDFEILDFYMIRSLNDFVIFCF